MDFHPAITIRNIVYVRVHEVVIIFLTDDELATNFFYLFYFCLYSGSSRQTLIDNLWKIIRLYEILAENPASLEWKQVAYILLDTDLKKITNNELKFMFTEQYD